MASRPHSGHGIFTYLVTPVSDGDHQNGKTTVARGADCPSRSDRTPGSIREHRIGRRPPDGRAAGTWGWESPGGVSHPHDRQIVT